MLKEGLVGKLAVLVPVKIYRDWRELRMSSLRSWSGERLARDFLIPVWSFWRSIRERRAAMFVVVAGGIDATLFCWWVVRKAKLLRCEGPLLIILNFYR